MSSLRTKTKRVLFVGLGGAGQRHLRIFKKLLPHQTAFSAFRSLKKTPPLNEDFSIDGESSLEARYGLKLFGALEESFEDQPDLVVIANPTSMHLEVAQKSAERNINVFVEKPFSNSLEGFDEFKKTVLKNGLFFFICFQRRFHPCLKRIKWLIAEGALGRIITAVFNVGSYVPAWHPYEDFRNLYACRKDLGGGVLLTEIHELDLCYWYFGWPEYIDCVGGNFSDVPLDVEDTAHVILKYPGFSVNINLCFMQKYTRRDLYIAGTRGYVEWSADGNKLKWVNYENNQEESFADPDYPHEAMFSSQAAYFLNEMSQSDAAANLEIAKASLAIVEAAKTSMQRGMEIKMNAAGLKELEKAHRVSDYYS